MLIKSSAFRTICYRTRTCSNLNIIKRKNCTVITVSILTEAVTANILIKRNQRRMLVIYTVRQFTIKSNNTRVCINIPVTYTERNAFSISSLENIVVILFIIIERNDVFNLIAIFISNQECIVSSFINHCKRQVNVSLYKWNLVLIFTNVMVKD